MNTLLKETIAITQSAANEIMRFYQTSFSVEDKSPDNPVTDADLASDRLLQKDLRNLLPEAGWLSEETADNPDRLAKKLCWVVDPLDGTKEFVMGIPEFSISVALVEDGLPIIAVILNPPKDELFYAYRGDGAFYKEKKVAVSPTNELLGAQVDASRSERNRGEFAPFEETVQLTTVGSIAYKLARVSAGLTDATWSRGPKHEWDICAGVLLIEEAGGKVVDLDNEAMRFNKSFPKVNGIIATNSNLYDQVITSLAPHRDTARVDKEGI